LTPPPEPPLRDLLAQAQAGDAEARDRLVRRLLPSLRTFVRSIASKRLREHEECSDLVQSVCREILRRLDALEFRGEAAFRLWLHQTARHTIMERARYWNRAKRSGQQVDLPPEAAIDPKEVGGDLLAACTTSRTPSDEVIGREEQQRIEDAFAALPAAQRRVVILHRLVGRSHRQIAAELRRSEGAVRQLLFRALSKLAQHLDRPPPEREP